MIERKILTEKVSLSGPNFLGFMSEIIFTPIDKPGWFLSIKDKDGKKIMIPIDYRIAQYCFGRIKLKWKGVTIINVWEHIGALRFLGIDGVVVEILYGNTWPPYLGGAGAYCQKLFPYLKPTGEAMATIEVKKNNKWQQFNEKIDRIVSIEKCLSNEIILNVSSQWSPFPKYQGCFTVNEESLEFLRNEVFLAKPQGYSHYYVAKIIAFFGWPNFQYISWAKDFKFPEELAYQWWLHRIQDFLGGLSLASYYALPIGRMDSINGGHSGDIKVISQSFND